MDDNSLAFLPLFMLMMMLPLFVIGKNKKGPDMKLILQDPMEFDSPADRCESDLCTSLVKLLDDAEETIDFAVYGTRAQADILEAILRAQDRGVIVRGYMDRDANNENYYSSTDRWTQEIGNIRDDYPREIECRDPYVEESPCKKPDGFNGPLQCLAYELGRDSILVSGHISRDDFGEMSIMHNKFFIVDKKRVWTGSANISNSGTGGYNANAVAVMRSSRIAEIYTEEFEQLWNRENKCSKSPNGIEEVKLKSGRVTTWFSPQDASLRYGVQGLIAKAEERINVAVFFLTAKYLTADLIAAHQRGVEVRVIIDATSAKNGYSKHEILREAGIPVKIENWGGKMHMKAASIDGKYLVLGSMNWTSAGQRSNDENTLLVRSSKLTRQFDSYYEGIWQSIPGNWQQKGVRPDPESLQSGLSCSDRVDNDFDELVDAEDPGCKTSPPPLPDLPPHRIVTSGQYAAMKKDEYPMIRSTTCDPSYPDWHVCIDENYRRGCKDLPYDNFTAKADGEHQPRLDGDGDGVACELQFQQAP